MAAMERSRSRAGPSGLSGPSGASDLTAAGALQALNEALPKSPGDEDESRVHFPWQAGLVLDCRYQIQELLGDGAFGRVLKARDLQEDTDVALKVIRDVERYRDNAQVEVNILLDIRKADPEDQFHCVRLLGAFLHSGVYFCIVTELLGDALYDFLKWNGYRGFWLQDIQSFARQTLRALAFLHSLSLTHTDLKPENILLLTRGLPHVSTFPRGELQPPSPRYAALPYIRPADCRVKLIDFGNATYVDMHHSSIIQTRQYRSPEVVLHLGWSEKADLWSLGCILWELYSGNMLFETHNSAEHLAMMERILEPFPESMLSRVSGKTKARFVAEVMEDEHRLQWPKNAESEKSVLKVWKQWPLEDRVPAEHLDFVHFLRGLLALEPWRREVPQRCRFLSMEYQE